VASGLAEVGAGEGLEEASLPDGGGVLDEAERAPAGAACWMQPAGVGRGDGVEAVVGRGDGVEAVDAAERAVRPGRRAGRSQMGAGRGCVLDAAGRASAGATRWRRASAGADGASAGEVGRMGRRPGQMRASGVGRGSTVSGRMRQTQGRRGGFRARGLEWP